MVALSGRCKENGCLEERQRRRKSSGSPKALLREGGVPLSGMSCISPMDEIESKLIVGTSSRMSRCHTPILSQSGVPITRRVQPEQLSGPTSRRARIKTRTGSRDTRLEGTRMSVVGIDVAKDTLVVATAP